MEDGLWGVRSCQVTRPCPRGAVEGSGGTRQVCFSTQLLQIPEPSDEPGSWVGLSVKKQPLELAVRLVRVGESSQRPGSFYPGKQP